MRSPRPIFWRRSVALAPLFCLVAFDVTALDIDTDFTKLTRPIEVEKPDKNLSITGALPNGWGQRSGFQSDLKLRFTPISIQGRSGMRAHKVGAGQIQLHYDVPVFEPGRYRLTFTGRNPDQLQIIAGVRQVGPGYQWTYRTQCTFGDEWQREVYEFNITKRIGDSGFFFIAKGPSDTAIDLAEFKLQRLTPGLVLDELRRQHPDGGPSNLFRNTTLDQGLPEGWSTYGRGFYGLQSTLEVVEDPDTPSGVGRALEMTCRNERMPLNSEPIAFIQRDQPHTLSFFHKGEGRWDVELHYDGGKQILAQESFRPSSNDWKRFTMTLQPDVFRERGYVHIRGTGRLRLDAFQLEPKAKATPFRRSHPAELSLHLANGVNDRAPVLSGSDTEAQLRVGIESAGTLQAVKLRVRIHDVYGTTMDMPAIDLPSLDADTTYAQQTVAVAADPARPFGAFRAEAWVENADGRRVSAFQERVFLRVPPARFAGRDAPESSFGVHFRAADWSAELLKAVGVNWVRLHDQGVEAVAWYFLEPEPGQWNFRDDIIGTLRDHDLSILGVLSTTPTWASAIKNRDQMSPEDMTRYFTKYFLPRDLGDWENYVTTLATRYRDDIRVYDLWNEPYGGGFFNEAFVPEGRGKGKFRGAPQSERYGKYMELGRVADAALHAVDPDIRLTFCVTKHDWLEALMDKDVASLADVLIVHRYVGGSLGHPDNTFQRETADQIAAAERVDRPLWMTEGSATHLTHRSGFLDHTLAGVRREYDPVHTAQQLSRYLLSNFAQGVERVFLYSARYGHFEETNTPWAVLLMEAGSPHPSAAAHAVFAAMLDGKRIAGSRALGDAAHAYAFVDPQTPDRSTLVITEAANADAASLDLSALPNGAVDVFGNPLIAGVTPLMPIFIETEWTTEKALSELTGVGETRVP